MIQLAAPEPKYDARNEAETRRLLEQHIARLSEEVIELQRRLKAAAIP